MRRTIKSEWFVFDSPVGEPEVEWGGSEYHIERVVLEDGETIWFGLNTNWKKAKGGIWEMLVTNEEAKPLEKYLPEIVYGEDRNIFVPCDIPIYEEMYMNLKW